jgi:hypothetical protein
VLLFLQLSGSADVLAQDGSAKDITLVLGRICRDCMARYLQILMYLYCTPLLRTVLFPSLFLFTLWDEE